MWNTLSVSVGEIADAFEVADRRVDVDRLDRIAARACSGCCASAPACRKLRKSAWLPGRRPRSRSEQFGADAICEMTRLLPPKRTLCAGLRAWMVNSDGAVRDQFEDHVAVEAHPLAAFADVGAMLLHDLAGAVMQHVDADFLEHAQRGEVDRFQLVVGDQLGRRERDLQLPERRLLEGRRAAWRVFRRGRRGARGRWRAPVRLDAVRRS